MPSLGLSPLLGDRYFPVQHILYPDARLDRWTRRVTEKVDSLGLTCPVWYNTEYDSLNTCAAVLPRDLGATVVEGQKLYGLRI